MVNINERIEHLNSYLIYLKICNTENKEDLIEFIDNVALKTKNISACLAVIYPRHPWRKNFLFRVDYRGLERFSRKELSEKRCTCELDRLWGYKCNNPLHSDEIQYDHLWPFALGGATNVDNLLALCPFHNFIKSNDYHWFPFEQYAEAPGWVIEQVIAIRKHL